MDIIYEDRRILVAIKPAGILSTDEAGGMPGLIREYLGDDKACVKTVHRLDQPVSGLMVFARSREASRILSEQISQRTFQKEYLAVIHGTPPEKHGTFCDLLARDKQTRTTYVTKTPGKEAQEAVLDYEILGSMEGFSLVKVKLYTGRTHQIRVQFSSRGYPLVGDKKYGSCTSSEKLALWSYRLAFSHPQSGEPVDFTKNPPKEYPWNLFSYG